MPRAGLSAELIVDEAARLVDEIGRDRLTLAELAKRFSVAQPSLYKHVGGIDALHKLLAERVLRDAADELRRAVAGRAGPDAWAALAAAYRGYAQAHPGRYGYLLPAPSAELAAPAAEVLGVLYAVFAGYAVADDDAVDAARFVRSALHGFVDLEVSGGFGLPDSVDRSFARLVAAVDHALSSWPPAAAVSPAATSASSSAASQADQPARR